METDVMKLAYTAKRTLFTSSALMVSLLSAASIFAASQAGCADQLITDTNGGGGSLPDTSTGDGVPCPDCTDDGGPDRPVLHPSDACAKCHTAISQDWKSSMHAHSISSPVMIAQTNQVFAADLIKEEGLKQFCTSCHSPLASLFAQSGTLPFVGTKPNATTAALGEGIGCVTCHSYRGNPKDSKAVLTDFQQDFGVGKNYFGPFDDPAPNGGFHQASISPLYDSTGGEYLCLNCHNLKADRDGDQVFELGTDLFLQTTFDEYKNDYQAAGSGKDTCIGCHMPVRKDVSQAADGFPNAPTRIVHDHRFVGVDYPLDEFAKGNDPQKLARRDLLKGGEAGGGVATLEVQNIAFDGAKLAFDVKLTNANGGHNLPTGFAFMRQMWLEVVVKDNDMNELGQSGELQASDNDLCDSNTLTDSLASIVQGCDGGLTDDQLVNFQTKLVDFVALQNGVLVPDPVKGHETFLQFQTGGAVARSRPADVKAGLGKFTLAPLRPFEPRSFHYSFVFSQQSDPIHLSTRLKFRNLPPYFMRALAKADSGKIVQLASLLSFEVVEMASSFQTVNIP
jgi:hypothetical protein